MLDVAISSLGGREALLYKCGAKVFEGLFTFSSCWPLMMICAVVIFALLTMTLNYLSTTDLHAIIPWSAYLSAGEVLQFTVAASIRSMSSAKRRLLNIRPPMEIVNSKSCSVFLVMFSMQEDIEREQSLLHAEASQIMSKSFVPHSVEGVLEDYGGIML